MATPAFELSADEHAAAMSDYLRDGEQRARELGNRGPIRFDDNGEIHPEILDEYWRCGFYVFEECFWRGRDQRTSRRRRPCARRCSRVEPGAGVDKYMAGRRSALGYERPSFRYGAPLSDPVGGTSKNKGRHPVKMLEPVPAADAPKHVIARIMGNLQLMDSCPAPVWAPWTVVGGRCGQRQGFCAVQRSDLRQGTAVGCIDCLAP